MTHLTLDFRSALLLVAAAACWGLATVATKSILFSIPPLTLLVIQLSFSSALLWSLVYLGGRPLPGKQAVLKVGLLGFLNPGISYSLSLIGLSMTTAAMSTLLWAAEPVLILLLAWLILRERLTAKLISLSIVALLGVILINGFGAGDSATVSMFGHILILGGVLCCALYTVLARRTGAEIDPIVAVALQQIFALIWAASIWPLELSGYNPANLTRLPMIVWFWAALTGIVYYALAFWFYWRGLARAGAGFAGASLNLIPIFGVGSAYIFLGERLSVAQWLGAGAIVISVFAMFWGQPKNSPSSITSPAGSSGAD